jgi:heat shock protein HslJ
MTPLLRAVTAALVLAALVAACSPAADVSPSPEVPGSLAGSAWRAVSVDGTSPVDGSEPTLVFTANEVNGTTGCNQFFGGYTYDAGSISITNVGMTMMACEGPISEVEAGYTAALNGATSVTVDDGGQLLLSGSAGEVLFAPDSTSSR